jgi:hypothetical protein
MTAGDLAVGLFVGVVRPAPSACGGLTPHSSPSNAGASSRTPNGAESANRGKRCCCEDAVEEDASVIGMPRVSVDRIGTFGPLRAGCDLTKRAATMMAAKAWSPAPSRSVRFGASASSLS